MAKIFELIFPQEVTSLSSPALRLVFGFSLTHTQHDDGRQILRGETMDWKQLLAYITGTVDQELLLRNEYLVTENRILRNQITGRVRLTDGERKTLAEMGQKLGKQALKEVAKIVKPDTILGWHRASARAQDHHHLERVHPHAPGGAGGHRFLHRRGLDAGRAGDVLRVIFP